MQLQSIINKLPEVIKCIIFDYVNNILNYQIEIISDKFIGNPIDMYKSRYFYHIVIYDHILYHINKLTKSKTPLHFIGLNYHKQIPQEILNKLQKLSTTFYKLQKLSTTFYNNPTELPNIKILNIYGNLIEIPNFKGLLELYCIHCYELTEIPNIVGLLKLKCHQCNNLTEIPHIKGLLKLNCSNCSNLTEIPHIEGLLELNCSGCNIIKIPHIVGLLKLDCSDCSKLTKIPNIKRLLELNCSWCTNLIEIPHIVGIKNLYRFGIP